MGKYGGMIRVRRNAIAPQVPIDPYLLTTTAPPPPKPKGSTTGKRGGVNPSMLEIYTMFEYIYNLLLSSNTEIPISRILSEFQDLKFINGPARIQDSKPTSLLEQLIDRTAEQNKHRLLGYIQDGNMPLTGQHLMLIRDAAKEIMDILHSTIHYSAPSKGLTTAEARRMALGKGKPKKLRGGGTITNDFLAEIQKLFKDKLNLTASMTWNHHNSTFLGMILMYKSKKPTNLSEADVAEIALRTNELIKETLEYLQIRKDSKEERGFFSRSTETETLEKKRQVFHALLFLEHTLDYVKSHGTHAGYDEYGGIPVHPRDMRPQSIRIKLIEIINNILENNGVFSPDSVRASINIPEPLWNSINNLLISVPLDFLEEDTQEQQANYFKNVTIPTFVDQITEVTRIARQPGTTTLTDRDARESLIQIANQELGQNGRYSPIGLAESTGIDEEVWQFITDFIDHNINEIFQTPNPRNTLLEKIRITTTEFRNLVRTRVRPPIQGPRQEFPVPEITGISATNAPPNTPRGTWGNMTKVAREDAEKIDAIDPLKAAMDVLNYKTSQQFIDRFGTPLTRNPDWTAEIKIIKDNWKRWVSKYHTDRPQPIGVNPLVWIHLFKNLNAKFTEIMKVVPMGSGRKRGKGIVFSKAKVAPAPGLTREQMEIKVRRKQAKLNTTMREEGREQTRQTLAMLRMQHAEPARKQAVARTREESGEASFMRRGHGMSCSTCGGCK